MIQVNNIDFNYPGSTQKIFCDFSLTLKENNIYGLLGKNGTGKSTLLYLLTGMLRPKKGSVMVNGMDATKRLPQMLNDIFLVPEEFDFPQVSLQRYVKINSPFYPHFSEEVLHQCLADFELDAHIHLGNLSMGQKKKVMMSFALATGTHLLLMDEPTNGMDIPSKSLFRRVIARNMNDDHILIISTHQIHDIETLLDHVVIIDQSQVLLDAPTADLAARYRFGQHSGDVQNTDMLYDEPCVQGTAFIARRKEDEPETTLNLELLFNAVTSHKIKL